jgi:hypothetical protein
MNMLVTQQTWFYVAAVSNVWRQFQEIVWARWKIIIIRN